MQLNDKIFNVVMMIVSIWMVRLKHISRGIFTQNDLQKCLLINEKIFQLRLRKKLKKINFQRVLQCFENIYISTRNRDL